MNTGSYLMRTGAIAGLIWENINYRTARYPSLIWNTAPRVPSFYSKSEKIAKKQSAPFFGIIILKFENLNFKSEKSWHWLVWWWSFLNFFLHFFNRTSYVYERVCTTPCGTTRPQLAELSPRPRVSSKGVEYLKVTLV